MDSLPTWAVWSTVMPLVLLSPVLAFLLAILSEALICDLVDVGAPAGVALTGRSLGLFQPARHPGRQVVPKFENCVIGGILYGNRRQFRISPGILATRS
jgi:hypothetical protein